MSGSVIDEPQSWVDLSEVEFCSRLENTIAETGNPGDVFPPMVNYNVPWFMLRQLWPAAWAKRKDSIRWMAFTAAEEGWRGRLDGLQSTVTPQGDGYQVRFRKTYVMSAAELLMLTRAADGEIALVLLEPQSDWQWQKRTEPGLVMRSTAGRLVEHHRLQGEAFLPADRVCFCARRDYSRVGMTIPRREVTGMAFMARGMRRHLGLATEQDEADLNEVRRAREAGRLNGAAVHAALRVLDRFFADADLANLEPFWQVIADFRRMVAPALEKGERASS